MKHALLGDTGIKKTLLMKDDSRCNDNVRELVHILNIMVASVITVYMAKLILWMVNINY